MNRPDLFNHRPLILLLALACIVLARPVPGRTGLAAAPETPVERIPTP
jgi:hypothetical protein